MTGPGLDTARAAASREVARLAVLFPPPWVISYRIIGGLVIYSAARPGLSLSQGSAQALEAELNLWERAGPRPPPRPPPGREGGPAGSSGAGGAAHTGHLGRLWPPGWDLPRARKGPPSTWAGALFHARMITAARDAGDRGRPLWPGPLPGP